MVHTHHRFIFWREGPCVRCTPSPVNTSPLKECVSAITVTSHMVMNKFCWKPCELFLYNGWQICQGKKKIFVFIFRDDYRVALTPTDDCSRPWKLISATAAFKAECFTMSWSCFAHQSKVRPVHEHALITVKCSPKVRQINWMYSTFFPTSALKQRPCRRFMQKLRGCVGLEKKRSTSFETLLLSRTRRS